MLGEALNPEEEYVVSAEFNGTRAVYTFNNNNIQIILNTIALLDYSAKSGRCRNSLFSNIEEYIYFHDFGLLRNFDLKVYRNNSFIIIKKDYLNTLRTAPKISAEELESKLDKLYGVKFRVNLFQERKEGRIELALYHYYWGYYWLYVAIPPWYHYKLPLNDIIYFYEKIADKARVVTIHPLIRSRYEDKDTIIDHQFLLLIEDEETCYLLNALATIYTSITSRDSLIKNKISLHTLIDNYIEYWANATKALSFY